MVSALIFFFSYFLTLLPRKNDACFFCFFPTICYWDPTTQNSQGIASYQKEADAQQAKITELEAQGADTADVNKQKEVLNETVAMIPECEARLKDAQADVEAILAGASDELKGQEMYNEALGVIQELGGTIAEAEEEDL